jgi:hypothetical protein
VTNRYHNLEAWRRTVAALMDDPDITGDLLLGAMWLARATILNEPERGEGRWSLTAMALDLYGQGDSYSITGLGVTRKVKNHHVATLRQAFKRDIPRYDWQADNDVLWHPFGGYDCASPMIRRTGLCGQHATVWRNLTDAATGRVRVLAACRRHRPWLDGQLVRNREEVRALGEHLPKPAANAGGALPRHIHGVAWAKWWTALDPTWTPPAEGAPSRKPKLTVLTFEPSDDDVHDAAVGAPSLTVLEGGWR